MALTTTKTYLTAIGITGAGKSTTMNVLINGAEPKANHPCVVGHSVESETGEIHEYPSNIRKDLVVVDTPGLGDTRGRKFMPKILDQIHKTGGYILFFIKDTRLNDTMIRQLKALNKAMLSGLDLFLVMVRTFPNLSEDATDEELRKQVLKFRDEVERTMAARGCPIKFAQIIALTNTRAPIFTRKEFIEEIFSMIDSTPPLRPYHTRSWDQVQQMVRGPQMSQETKIQLIKREQERTQNAIQDSAERVRSLSSKRRWGVATSVVLGAATVALGAFAALATTTAGGTGGAFAVPLVLTVVESGHGNFKRTSDQILDEKSNFQSLTSTAQRLSDETQSEAQKLITLQKEAAEIIDLIENC